MLEISRGSRDKSRRGGGVEIKRKPTQIYNTPYLSNAPFCFAHSQVVIPIRIFREKLPAPPHNIRYFESRHIL